MYINIFLSKIVKLIKNDGFKILAYLLLIDLVIGGSGHLLMFGGVSLRLVIFAIAMLYLIIYYFKRGRMPHKILFKIAITFLAWMFISAAIGLFNKNASFGSIVSDYLGYLPIALCPLFYEYFKIDKNRIIKFMNAFEVIVCLGSLIIIIMAIYSIIVGIESYQTIEVGIMRKYVYGTFDIIAGTGIPRVFTKGAIFIVVIIPYQILKLINRNYDNLVAELVKLVICFIALIFTFTVSFWSMTIIGLMIVLLYNRKKVRSLKISLTIIAVLLVAVSYFGLDKILMLRFSGNYTPIYKIIQIQSLAQEICVSPLIGEGLSKNIVIDYGYSTVSSPMVENAFFQLGVNSGLIGMLLFFVLCILTINKLRYNSKMYQYIGNIKLADIYTSLYIGLFCIFVINMTNPFLNNSIGLVFLAITIGLAEVKYEKQA